MIIGTHIILTGYGHWLPNDPRGSMSNRVHAPRIGELGEVHQGRREEQPLPEQIREFCRQAQGALGYPLRWFSVRERSLLAAAFGDVIAGSKITCYACAILTSHVHILVRRHAIAAQRVSRMLKEAGRQALRATFPAEHPVFSADCAHHFKSTPHLMWECITYINENFDKHDLPRERYPFVVDYQGWTPW